MASPHLTYDDVALMMTWQDLAWLEQQRDTMISSGALDAAAASSIELIDLTPEVRIPA